MAGDKEIISYEQERWGAAMWGSFLVLGRKLFAQFVFNKFRLSRRVTFLPREETKTLQLGKTWDSTHFLSRDVTRTLEFNIRQRTIFGRSKNQ